MVCQASSYPSHAGHNLYVPALGQDLVTVHAWVCPGCSVSPAAHGWSTLVPAGSRIPSVSALIDMADPLTFLTV